MTTNSQQQAAKAGLYLRNGAMVTPGIMTIDTGKLSFKTSEGGVFESKVSEVSATFSRYSTLTITKGGQQYVFVTGAYAGALAPSFSTEQLQEIAGTTDTTELNKTFKQGATILISSNALGNVSTALGAFAGRGIGIVGKLVAVMKLTNSQAQSFAMARAWAEYLKSQGVTVTMKGTTFGASQRFLWALILPIFIVFSIVVFLIVAGFSS
jgi:hypothetical protein